MSLVRNPDRGSENAMERPHSQTSPTNCRIFVLEVTGSAIESKGLINEPILRHFPLQHVFLLCLHINMGIWNKIFDTTKVNFAKSAEEPHMSRSEQAGFMNARIAQLEQVIVTKSGALVTLKCKHKSVKLILKI